MSVSVATVMTSSNIREIGNLIMFELSRRPSSGSYTDTSSMFAAGTAIKDEDVAKLVSNLSKAGQTVTAPAHGATALKSFDQALVDKLLAANAQQVNIS